MSQGFFYEESKSVRPSDIPSLDDPFLQPHTSSSLSRDPTGSVLNRLG